VEYVSENVPHVLGYSTEDFQTGKILFTDLMLEEDRMKVADTLQQSLKQADETLEYPELKLRHRDGTWIWVYIFTTIHRDESGEITHFFGYLINITPRKEAQAALLLSESKLKASNAAKDMFFSIIAHDLKSPFSNILGFCELLLMNYDRYTDEVKKEFIKTIEISAENTYKLLENLLLWSKSQRGMLEIQAEPVNLFLLWSESFKNVRDMAIRKEITITESFEKEMTVLADKNMLQTVFRNLLSNAIKFTPKGAWIKVSAGYSQELKGFAICCVEDSGVGISPENTEKLFGLEEKFSTPGTEEEDGTGLGLILCKDFIEKHGGRIWVETELGKGSRFYFSLPRA
jgi:PAS domain S-box-containing protein